ncbi:hypothetical protein FIBSPDRAFT_722605 [Athelia psychrophila]|uniref:Knr4/Smi1-like domain-containing protein n=1 Tax=Athelia psychrophila TaxID=1759441 RepID=A0A166VAZ5_9AGAM|nr:hypothetical protein FIBSPDRAFT_722605 [Fibularhizoctonia sp. CBS 109695]
MSWFVALFSGGNKNVRRGQAMNNTHEAFSLPTSSPIGSTSHIDAFNPDTLGTPDPERSFSYPPRSPLDPYGYGGPTSSGSRHNSLLPLHSGPLSPNAGPNAQYPPLPHTWNRLKTWLAREYPELGDTLNYGILPLDLAQIEMQFGMALPPAVRESYLTVDGQEAESSAGCAEGLFFGLTLLPLEDVLEEWRFWREVDDDPATGGNARLREGMQSIPEGWVRREYSQRGWIPLIVDKAGNYVGVDLNPGEGGAAGQVIVFGRDFDTKVVLWKGDGQGGWAKWLASFVDELESGEGYELGGSDASEGSEDGLGYESYYYDGTGRGAGDGGGDTSGGGGLKLTGEYRGWNVLEAWADRSLRKWADAGMHSGTDAEGSQKTKSKPRPTSDILSLVKRGGENGSGAEVIMPVLADVDEAPEYVSKPGRSSNVDKPLPTIAVTKPPAPMPLDLPTSRDIGALPSPPDSTHSSFDLDHNDLESGRAAGLRNFSNPRPNSRPAVASQPIPSVNIIDTSVVPEAQLVPLPETPVVAERAGPPPPAVSDITNLLDDEPSALVDIAVEPVMPEEDDEEEDDDDDDEDDEDEEEEEEEPATTIRLVGGGGSAGQTQPAVDEEVAEASGDAESVKSSTSADLKKDEEKTHKKSLSSGLKKIAQLGRKKDSVSSAKGSQS